MKSQITVETSVRAPIEKVWRCWTEPGHIKNWCFASPDWCVPDATNDVTVEGKFKTRMESRDGKMGFDFTGTYTDVVPYEKIEYTIDDGRKVIIRFIPQPNADGSIKITETFEAEDINSLEQQKQGWQTILDNFAKYVTA